MQDRFSFPEDVDRLPEGFKRIAYDSDTMRFTFRDCNGHLYQSEAGSEYGILTPMSTSFTSLSRSRPNAFASESSSIPTSRKPPERHKSTFQDILPFKLITTSSLSEKNAECPAKSGLAVAPHEQFVDVVRKSVLPKMQGVVHNLRRSVTSIRGKHPTPHLSYDIERDAAHDDETRGLIRSGSTSSVGSDIRRPVTAHPRSKYLRS